MIADFSRRAFLAGGAGAGLAAPPKLQYRTLGRTGLKVTTLGFGTMLVSDAAVVERAADIGINFFDTARSYQSGNNERMVGAALKGKRQKIVLCSKSGGRTKQEALQHLDTSLKEIGTDYLDIWYLHARSKPEEITDELLEAQSVAKKAGKIRFAGVSTHLNMREFIPWVVQRGQTDVMLTTYNFTTPYVAEAIETATRAGVGIVGMKVMAGGYARIKKGDRLYGSDPNALFNRLQGKGGMLAALKWTLKNTAVSTAIIGMTDFDELDENLKAMSEPFGKEDAALLARQTEFLGPLYCRMCGSCSCPKGVAVPDTLRCLTYSEGYGEFALARSRYIELPQGVRCIDCHSCAVKCPNGVRVRERLIQAQELLA